MLMHLEWSVFSLADREAIFDYIETDNPRAAIVLDDRIQSRIEDLAQFPEMGRPGRIEGTRELVISHTPYIAAYRIIGDIVRILRVLHGAQKWPDEILEEPE
ncbi:MAG TPA: type II toxin-antitoxin system RelE/ParE family toxin [Terracidiphilus sp.]|nr:type II toxin-antitoxin system RelE/ParE family toxin [Terracidiphilus sp.]